MSTYCRGSAALGFGLRGAISSNRLFTPSGVGMVVIGKIARINFTGAFINARAGTLLPRGARKCLPADKIKIQVFVNGREIIGVAGDEVSTDSPRCQRNQYIKVNLPGFLDSVSFRLPKSIHDPS